MDVFAAYEQSSNRQHSEQRRTAAVESSLRDAVDGLMSRPQGRLFLRWLLQQCRSFSVEDIGATEASQSVGSRLLFTEGRRMVGMNLMRLLQQADAGHLPTLLQTRENDAHDLDCF